MLTVNRLYFVHGVGGDAFSSWVCDATGHMWPRDSLPEQCLNLGVRGRFSTLGYDAKVLDGGQPKTIHHAAESILKYIAADRPLVSILRTIIRPQKLLTYHSRDVHDPYSLLATVLVALLLNRYANLS